MTHFGVSEEEYKLMEALGYGVGKKIYNAKDNIERWLNENESVEFTNPSYSSNNVKFTINNDSRREIWFSQLSRVYITGKDRFYTACKIILKDNSTHYIPNLTLDDFVKITKCKHFRVSTVKEQTCYIDINNEKVKNLITLNKIIDYIYNNLESQNYDAIKGMTQEGKCYILTEE